MTLAFGPEFGMKLKSNPCITIRAIQIPISQSIREKGENHLLPKGK